MSGGNLSVRDLVALIAAARDAAGRVRDGIAGSVATGGEALDRLGAAGIGGSAAGAEAARAVELLGEALTEAEHLDGHLEKCRFIAMSAITGLYSNGTGGYTVPKSGNQTDDPTTWERRPHGETFLEPAGDSRASRGRAMLRRMMQKPDDPKLPSNDLSDAANNFTNPFEAGFAVKGADAGVPPAGTTATFPTVLFEPPRPPAEPGHASVELGVTLLGIVTGKAVKRGASGLKNTVKALMRKWTHD